MPQHPPRILIVDPRDLLRREYAGCAIAVGFHLECAEDYEQGLAKATFLAPDVILTDCSLDSTGLDFCRRLKTRLSTSRIPVLGLVAGGDAQSAQAVIAAGGTALVRPCSPERLLVEIAALLDARVPESPISAPLPQTPTVEQVTEMLGWVLREHADLVLRHADLTRSANLWANWYERTLTRAKQAPLDAEAAAGTDELIAQLEPIADTVSMTNG